MIRIILLHFALYVQGGLEYTRGRNKGSKEYLLNFTGLYYCLLTSLEM